jgi:hypothetical protein
MLRRYGLPLGLRQVVEVAQHEHGALARRQPAERLEQFGARVERR